VPFGNGFPCAGGGLTRLNPPVTASGDEALRAVDLADAGIVPSTQDFQCWFRGPAAGGAFFTTSDGVSVAFVP